MTDTFRALCVELIEIIEEHCNPNEYVLLDVVNVLNRARAALAQPEPQGPTDAELETTARAAEIQYMKEYGGLTASTPDGIYAQLQAQRLAGLRAVAARWGRPAIEPEGPTNDDGIDEEAATVILWLLEEAAHAADADQSYAAGKLTLAAQLLGERRPAIEPVPVSERLPGPEDCDADGRCWMCGKVEGDWRLISTDNPGVPQLKYAFSHWLPRWALPVPGVEGADA
jgi:hypothetical protein